MKAKKIQLKNGLQVLLVNSHKSPVVSIQMWVRTGSADEKKGEEGLSHFIEHLVFKGTRKFKVGEIASQIEGSGGELNAYTSFDQTVFYVTISKNFLETGMLAISEMMGYPLFDKKEIDNEREVVIEEIKRGNDSLGRRASQLLFSTAYTKHPYGIPVIGYDNIIKKVSAKKITDYYHARYTPKNMFLVVAGDFDKGTILEQIKKYFAEIKSYKVKKIIRKKEPKQIKPRIAVEKADFEQSIGYLAWRTPGIKHKDIPALDLLSMVLGAGDSSRLTKKLRIDAATVNSVGASVFSPENEGLFAISLGYDKENLDNALEGIKECYLDLFSKPVLAHEIERAIINLESDKFYSVETVDGLARNIGSQEFTAKDQHFFEKYLKAIGKVKPEDLKRVAVKYLDPKKIIVAFITNDNSKETEKKIKDWLAKLTLELKNLKNNKIKHEKFKVQKIKSLTRKLNK